MIKLVKRYNRHGQRCRYYLNERADLRLFESESFDVIYSSLVLQHMTPTYAKSYIKEFLRVLVPGGLLVFQFPGERLVSTGRVLPVPRPALPQEPRGPRGASYSNR